MRMIGLVFSVTLIILKVILVNVLCMRHSDDSRPFHGWSVGPVEVWPIFHSIVNEV